MLLAIDTGGTKTLIAGFNRAGQPGAEHRFMTPLDRDDYIAHLQEVITQHYKINEIDAIVLAVPGNIRNNIVEWCGNLPWENFDIAKELRKIVGCPVWIENDANLAGLAEVHSLRKKPSLGLYITISTGIGTGIITHGSIDPALSLSEGGHMQLEYKDKVQDWEDFGSGRAIKSVYGKYARDIHDQKTWRQIADRISRGLLVLIPMLQPDTIIIGGSIGTYFDRYSSSLQQLLTTRLPGHIALPVIRQAIHPEEAVIYGCYYYGTAKLEAA